MIILAHNKKKQYNVSLFDDNMLKYNGWCFEEENLSANQTFSIKY